MDDWRELHDRFMALRDEEEHVIQQHAPRFYLRAKGVRGGANLYGLWEFSHQVPVMGNPDPERICTSHVERQNLTIRMQMRRLTRLTNAFTKKWENLWAAYCLHFACYNFGRIHRSIRVTPAMEAGITDHVWELKELLA
jgi:hypothetical protein